MIAGCLNNNGSKVTSSVRFGFQINKFDSTLVAGNSDSVKIERVRFVYGDGAVVVNGDTSHVVPSASNWIQFSISQNSNNPIPMFQGNAGTYSNFVLSVQQAPDNNSNIDPDFTEDTRHSIIIDGKYNGKEFSYKSDRAFKTALEISPSVQVPSYNASYVFLINTSPELWFDNHQGGFYDPKISDDSTGIINNIEQSFSIETINNS